MKHTPFGYRIEDGTPVINEEQAEKIRETCLYYLSGMSFSAAAREAGLQMVHSQVKHTLLNPRYLGEMGYPPILTKEIMEQVEVERQKREEAYGHERWKKGNTESRIYTVFSIPSIEEKYKDPIRQAEYAFSMLVPEEEGEEVPA